VTFADIAHLPVVVDLLTAARVLGIGRTTAYGLARAGEFPCPVVRVGGTYRVPTAGLLRLLGLDGHSVARPRNDPDHSTDRAKDRELSGLGLPRDLPAARA
jgi:excisionase family DNA binding protein